MRKVLLLFLLFSQLTWALDRQPNSDYRMRRQALASKTGGGAVLLFASDEAEGPNDLYGYRPDDSFFYLSGWSEPRTQKSCFFPTTTHPRRNGPDQSSALTIPTPARLQDLTTSRFSTVCARNWFASFRQGG